MALRTQNIRVFKHRNESHVTLSTKLKNRLYSRDNIISLKIMMIGFIVNPIAGMGGKVGLKGTDNVLKEALTKGAQPIAPDRAKEFLLCLKRNRTDESIELLTCPGRMGQEEATGTGFPTRILPMKIAEPTSAEDTKRAVNLLVALKADLLVFVGGDGTARDVFDTIQKNRQLPVVGVPSGVKMYSGIFAVSPLDAAEVVLAFSRGGAQITDLEIMDSDEDAIRQDTFALRLHGLLKGPFVPSRIQGSKQISPESDDEVENQKAIGRFILEQIPKNETWILGPGTTVKTIAQMLGAEKTLLGVDIYDSGKTTCDVNEKGILKKVKDWKNAWIIVSPIGRQGILFGRGNQQISPEILRRVERDHVIVAATKNKLQTIQGNVLRVDTENAEVDRKLKGYVKVVTDYREWRLIQVQ